METKKYARMPFEVDAVQLTEENMDEVATWCGGTVIEAKDDDKKHIKVEVVRAMNDKQTKAYIGDWVLKAGAGFKVYTAKAFDKGFTAVGNTADEVVSVSDK